MLPHLTKQLVCLSSYSSENQLIAAAAACTQNALRFSIVVQRWFDQTTDNELLKFPHVYTNPVRAALRVLHETLKHKNKIVNHHGSVCGGIDQHSQSRIIEVLDSLDSAFANKPETDLGGSIVSLKSSPCLAMSVSDCRYCFCGDYGVRTD